MSDEDAALLRRIAQGDEDALAGFYWAHQARVYRFALSRLNDPYDAADILNEVMLEVWRTASRFAGRSAPTTWVLGIARHKVLDRLRARGRHPADELDESIPDRDAPAPADVVAAAEDARRVRRCLEGLSDAHREVVHLAFYEDLSYAEIATIAGVPEGTVKTRMYHARRALQHCLESATGRPA